MDVQCSDVPQNGSVHTGGRQFGFKHYCRFVGRPSSWVRVITLVKHVAFLFIFGVAISSVWLVLIVYRIEEASNYTSNIGTIFAKSFQLNCGTILIYVPWNRSVDTGAV